MDVPKIDDFRIERQGDQIVVIFTPDGRSYTFRVDGDQLSDPAVSPAQVKAADYAENEIRKAAAELARLALKGAASSERSPSQPRSPVAPRGRRLRVGTCGRAGGRSIVGRVEIAAYLYTLQ